jgi:hypothetical protein
MKSFQDAVRSKQVARLRPAIYFISHSVLLFVMCFAARWLTIQQSAGFGMRLFICEQTHLRY